MLSKFWAVAKLKLISEPIMPSPNKLFLNAHGVKAFSDPAVIRKITYGIFVS